MKKIFVSLLLSVFIFVSFASAAPKLERLDIDYSGQSLTSIIKGSPTKKYGPPDYHSYQTFGLKIGSPQYFRKNTENSSGEAAVFKGLGDIGDSTASTSFLTRVIPVNLNFRPNNQRSNARLQSAMFDNPQALEYLNEYDKSQTPVEQIGVITSILAVGVGAGALMIAFGSPA
ncbi:MAG: hypothetical protein WCT39_05420, partial [Candidatus Margulisiibacteriota bacterium]